MANVTRVVLAVDSTQVRQGTADLRAMQGQGQRTQTAVAQVGRAIAGIAAGVSLVATTRQVVAYADAWQNAANALRQVTSSSEQLTDVQNKLMAVSKETRSGFESTANLYSRLTRATSEMGLSQSDVIALTTTINKSFAVSGASASEAAAAITQLSQGLASGALRGDEFNSVAEQAPALMRAIADSTNMTIGELRAFAATGGITAEIVVTALQKASSQIDDQFSKSVATFGQAWVSASDNMMAFVGRSTAVNSAMAAAGSAIVTVSNNLHIMGNAIAVVAIVGVGKLVSSVAASTVALYAQAVAATRATVSVDALGMATARTTAAQTAMAAASRAGAAALMFLGGPVGIAVIAAGAIYAFREELGLVKPPAEDAMKAVNDLAAGIDNLTAAEARNRLGGVADKLGEIMLAAKEQQKVVDDLNRLSGAAGNNAGMSAIVERETKKLKLLQDQTFALAKTATTLQKTIARETRPKPQATIPAAIIPDTKPAFDWADYMVEYSSSLDDAARSVEGLSDEFEQLKRRADPAYKTLKENEELRAKLDDAVAHGKSREEANAIYDALTKVEDANKGVQLSTIETMKVMQGAFERGAEGYNQIEAAIQGVNAAQQVQKALSTRASAGIGAMAGAYSMAAAAVGTFLSALDAIGGKFTDTAAERQATQGISLFGDKSDSIAKSTEITARATSDLVGLNRSMLTALTGLQSGISGTATQAMRGARVASFDYGNSINVSQTGGQATNLAFGMLNVFTFGLFDGLFNSIGKALFGGKSRITDQGIKILGGTMGELIQETLAGAYQETQFKKYRWSGTRKAEAFTEDSALGQQIGLVFEGIADSVYAGAQALGMSGQDASDAINAFVLETQRISLKGLSAADQQAEIEAVFSTIFDDLTGSVVPFLGEFQNAGEALGETLARVATNVQVTEAASARLGFTAERLGVEQFATLSTALIDAAGGLDAFLNGMASFIERMAPASYQAELVTSDLSAALERVGLTVPATRDAMWELMRSLDAGTESGRAQIAALLSVTSLADTYYKNVEEGAQAAESAARSAADAAKQAADQAAAASAAIASERVGLERQILQLQGDTATLRAMDLEQIHESNRGLQERIWAMEDERAAQEQAAQAAQEMASATQAVSRRMSEAASKLQSELSGIGSALARLRGQSAGATAASRASAISLLQNAMQTGNLAGTGEAAGIAAGIEAGQFGSRTEFEREAGRTMFLLDALEREGKMQLSAQEQTVALLENIDRNIARSLEMPTASVPGFAGGGYHSGGLRIVGEAGPELEMTGPSRVISNANLSSALSANAELLAEIRDMKTYIRQTTKNTGESRDILNRWNRDGMPEQRELFA